MSGFGFFFRASVGEPLSGAVEADRRRILRAAEHGCDIPHPKPLPGGKQQNLLILIGELSQRTQDRLDLAPNGSHLVNSRSFGPAPNEPESKTLSPFAAAEAVRQGPPGHGVQPRKDVVVIGWSSIESPPENDKGVGYQVVGLGGLRQAS